jgi:two-component system, LuxR family, response regulator FixJ
MDKAIWLDSTVFLIDEDAAVRDAVSISLSMAGFIVKDYPSGKAFLDVYSEDQPGCLLINLSQPEMEGLTVQQELIKRNFSIPVIFMTEIGSVRDSVLAMQSGAFCFLEKPIPRPLLLESIREAMRQDLGRSREGN